MIVMFKKKKKKKKMFEEGLSMGGIRSMER